MRRHDQLGVEGDDETGSGAAARSSIARQCDTGTTLTELLVTVVIMGIVIVPVMNAVIGAVRASSSNRGLAQVETALNNAADKINRAPKSCDYSSYAKNAALLQGWSADDAWVSHRRFQPGPTPSASGTWVDGACQGSQPDDLLVQMVEVTVRNPETGAQRTIQVVKSDV
ncbi:MAG: type II secretion system protein [Acidimicrobiales bacterium]|nr:type II secretion system protein [Acidimicrobiales bacterium]MCB9393915.1 type II secretion system protein [Acidimicrobiaceae bacterium]